MAAATAAVTKALEQQLHGPGDGHGAVGLDGVAHFAGVNEGGPLVEMSDTDFERVMNVNVTGVWRVEKVRERQTPPRTTCSSNVVRLECCVCGYGGAV